MREKQKYLLDTNIASDIIKGKIKKELQKVLPDQVCVSVITQAELLHGVAKKPEAKNLPLIVNEFLIRVDILPFNSKAAQTYATLRAYCESKGKILSAMDMLIAAHALSVDAVLVTNDKAFKQVSQLQVIQWSE